MPPSASDEFLTVFQIAELLKVNQQTVRNWIDRHQLPAVRIGARRVRVRRVDLDGFLAAGATLPDETRLEPEPDVIEAREGLAHALSSARAALDGEDEPGLAGALRELAAAADRLAGVLGPG